MFFNTVNQEGVHDLADGGGLVSDGGKEASSHFKTDTPRSKKQEIYFVQKVHFDFKRHSRFRCHQQKALLSGGEGTLLLPPFPTGNFCNTTNQLM